MHSSRASSSLLSLTLIVCIAASCTASEGSDSTAADAITVTSTPVTSTPVTSTAPDTPIPGSSTSPDSSSVATSSPTNSTIGTTDGEVVDASRDRRIPYRIFAPESAVDPLPLILVSHGGFGSDVAHLSGGFLGRTFAAGGFVAMHIGHATSTGGAHQTEDRPADVTFVLDRLADGTIDVPRVEVDLQRIGITGHSYGAYTALAVGGATFDTTFTDDRIDAIAPISPQGPDQFGAFDRGPDDNTWMTVTIPSYNVIGGEEVDSNAIESLVQPGWRLVPFDRYPGSSDTFETIIADQTHADMWLTGAPEVQRFEAQAILQFFQRYVAGDESIDACTIGEADPVFAVTRSRAGSNSSELLDCPV
ncbi:MAG: hypothetical protein WBP59_02025 [Ilumatobacteraceae bacterium]